MASPALSGHTPTARPSAMATSPRTRRIAEMCPSRQRRPPISARWFPASTLPRSRAARKRWAISTLRTPTPPMSRHYKNSFEVKPWRAKRMTLPNGPRSSSRHHGGSQAWRSRTATAKRFSCSRGLMRQDLHPLLMETRRSRRPKTSRSNPSPGSPFKESRPQPSPLPLPRFPSPKSRPPRTPSRPSRST